MMFNKVSVFWSVWKVGADEYDEYKCQSLIGTFRVAQRNIDYGQK